MALHGSIEEAGLPNVLQLLALGRKTGRIAVEKGTVHGAIYLDAGVVAWAEIVSAGDRLGDHLVRGGKITREQLRRAIEALTRDSQRTLAEVLLDAGTIARGELDRFVQHQVEEAVYLMCSWTKGQFNYAPNAKPPRHAIPVSLQAERLLLEAGRRADDWTVIQIAIPSFDRVYRRAAARPGAAAGPELTSDQHRILPLLDGTRDVNGLIELSGMSAYEVGKALLDLITSQRVQLQDRRSSARHFDDADLRAYALRAGEFADPEHRKDAARHIADCAMCSGRLREVNARRDQVAGPAPETPAPEAGATEPDAAEPAAPGYQIADAKPQPPVPAAARPPAAPPAAPRRTTDFVWLMSPEEASRMATERRLAQRAEDEQARARSAAAAPPPAEPPTAAVPPAQPLTTPVARSATPSPSRPVAKPVAAPATPTAEAVARAPRAPPAEQPPIRRRVPWRALAIVAAGAVIVFGGYVAARAGRRPPARAATTSVASTPARTPAPAPSPPAESAARSPAMTVPAAPVHAAPVTDSVREKPLVPPGPMPSPDATPARRTAARDSVPAPPTVPLAPDAELAAGGWRPIDRAEAISILGGRIGVIPGLRIETITTSEARGRSRVRVAQIARSGQRIVLIESAGAEVPSSGAVRATAVSVMPPLEASGESIGSASLGNLQITARSSLASDALRSLLARLSAQSQP